MTLSELCLRRPVLAIVASVLIVVFGLGALTRIPIRELPDVDTAEVTVSVEYLGAAPAVVDAEITTVIEGAIAGVAGISTISSEAERGSSRTVITFETGRDIDTAANDIRAAVERVASDLPEEAEAPEVDKNDTEGEPVLRLTMSSDAMSPAELTDYADRYVVDGLATASGVADVELYGERAYAMRIWLDAAAMAARDVTVADVTSALEANNVELPAGEIETQSRSFQVRTETRFDGVEDFERLVIRDGEARVLLRDVAAVELGVEDDDSIFRSGGEAAIGLGVLRQSRANTVEISAAVRAELDALADQLPEGMRIEVSSDDAIYIRDSIYEVLKTLGIAVALVIGVIFAFLASPKATLIPAVTIPIALIGAGAGMAIAGFSINILTLFALILAIGLVVDDAIVVLENIQRRIEAGETPLVASALGAKQVTFAVIATSATLIAVFVPLSLLEGEVGRLFTEFGLVLAMAVAVSTFVALSLCPVMAAALLPERLVRGRFGRLVDRAFAGLSAGYRAALTRAVAMPAVVLGVVAVISGSAYALYRALPSELTPEEDRGVFFVNVEAPQGSNLAYTDAAVREVEAVLQPYLEDGVVTDVISLVGRYGEVQQAFVVASLADWGARDRRPQDIVAEIEPALAEITLAEARASTPGGLGVGGGSTPLQVIVGAPNFEQAAEWSETLADLLRENPNLTNVEREYDLNQPGYSIAVDRERARDLGIDARTVSEALQTLFASAEVTEFIERDRQYPVILQAREADRDAPSDLTGVSLRTEEGAIVPLDGLITVERGATLRAFNRFDRLPSVEISAGLAEGYDLGTAIEAVEAAAEELPEGATIAYDGESREFQETSSGVAATFGIALLVVFLVLAAQFESFVLPVVIMLSVPLAITGALFTLLLAGESLNIYSQVGLVLLIGLMAKNGILIVEFANQLRGEGREVREAVVEAAAVRLRPILMTVLSTVLGAVPLVLSSGAGAESRFAIGIVIIGGFATASVLTLFLTPVLYDLLARFTAPPQVVAGRLDAALAERGEGRPAEQGGA